MNKNFSYFLEREREGGWRTREKEKERRSKSRRREEREGINTTQPTTLWETQKNHLVTSACMTVLLYVCMCIDR